MNVGNGRVERWTRDRAAVISGLLLDHHQSKARAYCSCGYLIPESEVLQDHQGRVITSAMFGTLNTDRPAPRANIIHEGNAYNVATHRAKGERYCIACHYFLDTL